MGSGSPECMTYIPNACAQHMVYKWLMLLPYSGYEPLNPDGPARPEGETTSPIIVSGMLSGIAARFRIAAEPGRVALGYTFTITQESCIPISSAVLSY